MAPRRNIKPKKTEPIVVTTPVLDELGLENGTEVRFRLREDQNWVRGRVRGDNKDGSLTIFDRDGKSRAIMPGNVQVKVRGPRGGTTWEDIK